MHVFTVILPSCHQTNVGESRKASDNMTRINIASGKGVSVSPKSKCTIFSRIVNTAALLEYLRENTMVTLELLQRSSTILLLCRYQYSRPSHLRSSIAQELLQLSLTTVLHEKSMFYTDV